MRLPTTWGQSSVSQNAPAHDDPISLRLASLLTIPSAVVIGPRPAPTVWLQNIERRIRNSVVPVGKEHENDGRWLSSEMATAATAFFQLASDVLPGEPHIYSSLSGELIAESKTRHGVMNAVISPRTFVALPVIDGDPQETTRIEWTAANPARLRDTLKQISEKLRNGEHGRAMGA